MDSEDVKLSAMRGSLEPVGTYRRQGERFTTQPDVRHEEMHPPPLRAVTAQDTANARRDRRLTQLERALVGTDDKPGVYSMMQTQAATMLRMESMHRQAQSALWLIAGAWSLLAVAIFVYVMKS